MKISFEHRQSAHCENGVTANLLYNKGVKLTEPLVFGIGSGLFFSHMPFIKLNGIPVTSFRPLPGIIFSRAARRLGIRMKKVTFREPLIAMEALDKNLADGIPTGCVVGVFHLSYFPTQYRFHFNAHNLVVFGKEDNRYLISDPVMQGYETLSYEELKRVRFAKGTAPPKGKMYWPVYIPENPDIRKAAIKGIRKTCYDMIRIPLHFFGVKGIRFLGRRIRKWPKELGEKKAALYLGQVVRMQEEIGTGGAGFRFIFAAFLAECSELFSNDEFKKLALEMTVIGDKWREFAVQAARICKNRSQAEVTYDTIADMLDDIADAEEKLFTRLYAFVKALDKKY